jgi:UDP-glucose 4-epimerase
VHVLVTGGAGYIGSHMVRVLLGAGHEVLVVDDLSAGHRDAIPPEASLVVADVRDKNVMRELIRERQIHAIFHFASRIQVGESVTNPRLYWNDNLGAAVGLLEAALDAKVTRFVLSSTAAVYGTPLRSPIDEAHPTAPINPYGATKLAIEWMLASYARAYDFSYVALRYFNAAGADTLAGLGERHAPETHGRLPQLTVFGDDYATPDGTCVRDYVHVCDLADAHLLALQYLDNGGESGAFNLGTGVGSSVKEVIAAARAVTGREIPATTGARRPGDPPVLVASAERAHKVLGWRPSRSSLDRIVRDAWDARRG